MSKVEEDKLIYDALNILKNRFKRGAPLSSPAQVREYLALKLPSMSVKYLWFFSWTLDIE